MGGWFSKEERNDKVDNFGNTNVNNVVIAEPIEIAHWDLIVCIYIITVSVVTNLSVMLWKTYRKNLKKKIINSNKI